MKTIEKKSRKVRCLLKRKRDKIDQREVVREIEEAKR